MISSKRGWKRALVLLGALAVAQSALSQCRFSDTLVARYGINFSGFAKPLPRVANGSRKSIGAAGLLSIALPSAPSHVADGFEHRVLIDPKKKLGWIERRGGFVGVDEWYGPIALAGLDWSDCQVEAYLMQPPDAVR